MQTMLFPILLLCLIPAAAHAQNGERWDGRDSTSSLYDQDDRFDEPDYSSAFDDRRERDDSHRDNDDQISNGFGGTSSKTLGETVLDQLQPASGR